MLPSKRELLVAFVEVLREEVRILESSYQNAMIGATHEESRAEDPKDMRSTEASYLALGIAKSLSAKRETLKSLEEVSNVKDESSIPVVCYHVVHRSENDEEKERIYVVSPLVGGLRVDIEKSVVVGLNPQTPIAKALKPLEVNEETEHPMLRHESIEIFHKW